MNSQPFFCEQFAGMKQTEHPNLCNSLHSDADLLIRNAGSFQESSVSIVLIWL
jgi:hypothetical protein